MAKTFLSHYLCYDVTVTNKATKKDISTLYAWVAIIETKFNIQIQNIICNLYEELKNF